MSTQDGTRIIQRGNNHEYRLDGQKVPGVTTVLDHGVPKPALVGWAANTVAEYVINHLHCVGDHISADQLVADLRAYNATRKWPEKLTGDLPRVGLTKVLSSVQYAERDAAKNRGTEVHRLAEALAQGLEVDVPDELSGHVDSYLQFLEEWDPTDALLEFVVVNRRWQYMGRGDMIATVDHPALGPRVLFDIKTGRSGAYPDTGLQLAGYRFAETMLEADGTETPMPEVDSCAVIWVRADGYDVYRYDVDQGTFRAFLYAKALGDWLDRDAGPAATIKSDALRPPVVAR